MPTCLPFQGWPSMAGRNYRFGADTVLITNQSTRASGLGMYHLEMFKYRHRDALLPPSHHNYCLTLTNWKCRVRRLPRHVHQLVLPYQCMSVSNCPHRHAIAFLIYRVQTNHTTTPTAYSKTCGVRIAVSRGPRHLG